VPEPSLIRTATFAAALAALVATGALLLLGSGAASTARDRETPRPPVPVPPTQPERDAPVAANEDADEPSALDVATDRQRQAIEGATRRYLRAFGHYERANRSSTVVVSLEHNATPTFARELFDQSLRTPAQGRIERHPGQESIEAVLLPTDAGPPRAQATGTTATGETFSYFLELTGTCWLISGVAP